MSRDNVGWSASRIHGELRMLGITVSQATVANYMFRLRKPPSQTWRTFLDNHVTDLVSIDFFKVPAATFRILYVFVVLSHDLREIIQFNVTQNPTAHWTAQQIVEDFPFDTAPRSLWQSPYVERLIGSIPRECLNHVIVLNERHLRRRLRSYFTYYHDARTHLSLAKQYPKPRSIEPPNRGRIVSLPHVGGLQYEYRRAA